MNAKFLFECLNSPWFQKWSKFETLQTESIYIHNILEMDYVHICKRQKDNSSGDQPWCDLNNWA